MGPTLTDWLGLSLAETESRLSAAGFAPVHAAALWRVFYRGAGEAEATLPAQLRGAIDRSREALLADPPIARHVASADGYTEKFLLTLSDGAQIETVVMGYPGRFTACVSTQVGCAMGCVFCATGQMGFVRHLTPAEIVSQVRFAVRRLAARGDQLRNVVLMGMGEPLHNYDHVMTALDIVSDHRAFGLAPSRITVNTVGVVPGILRMAAEQRPYCLGVSLHGSTAEERRHLVPVDRRWPLEEVLEACRQYQTETGRRIFFAWTLIEGVNDSVEHAGRLVALLEGLDAHVNLINLNATAGFVGRSAARPAAEAFRTAIRQAGIPCTIRQRRGIDVAAGCGQLRAARAV
jgi:23S rRNA (adenine2503-C2)-methyltransferase